MNNWRKEGGVRMRLNVVIGLLGLIAGLLIAIAAGTAERPAFAQAAGRADMMTAVAANYNNGQEDIIWVLDAVSRRLAVYKYKDNKTIELIGVRNIMFDLQVEEMNYDGRHLKPSDLEELLKKRKEGK
jgi:hypothetical protein